MLGLLEIRQHIKEAVKTKLFYIYNSRERDTAQDNDTSGWSDDLGHDSSFESLPVPRNVCPLSLPTFISLKGTHRQAYLMNQLGLASFSGHGLSHIVRTPVTPSFRVLRQDGERGW